MTTYSVASPTEQRRRSWAAPTGGGERERSLQLGAFRVLNVGKAPFLRLLRRRLGRREKTTVLFANANFVVRCAHLARAAESDGVVIVNDGVAAAAAARLRHGKTFRDNLNGTDFTPLLLASLPSGSRVALAGASAEAVAGAARVFAALPNDIEVVDVRDGFAGIRSQTALDEINAARPDVLLVAMGNPLQEEWILANRDRLEVPLILGVGALFDFTAGLVDRAPQFIRRVRLEWAYRLSREPRRLLKRYTVDTARFFLIVMLQKDSASRSRASSTRVRGRLAAEAASAGLPKGDGRARR